MKRLCGELNQRRYAALIKVKKIRMFQILQNQSLDMLEKVRACC